ncbi:Uncharacterised protein [Yersinia enterocolitica]|nr:Uncharacterised protein [Yersinia enterocolitica]
MFDIQHNGAGFTISGEEIEQVVDINIETITQRDKVRKANFPLLRPIQNGICDCSRLGDKRQSPFFDGHGRETGIQPLPRCQ